MLDRRIRDSDNESMKPADLLDHWKTKSKIARALGCTPATVAGWFDLDYIPEGRQYQVELATKGKLKADRPANRTT